MKKLMTIGAFAIIAVSLVYMVFVTPHVPLLDANRQVLAETEMQGYCAGHTFLTTRGVGSMELVNECYVTYEGLYMTDVDTKAAATGICMGIVAAGWGGTVDDCMNILISQRLWMTVDGRIADQWNNRFPYPLSGTIDTVERDDSRTGGRDTTNRESEVPYRP